MIKYNHDLESCKTKCKCGGTLVLENRSKDTTNILKAKQVALVCSKCGKWIKWCSIDERSKYTEVKNTEKPPTLMDYKNTISIKSGDKVCVSRCKNMDLEIELNRIGYSRVLMIIPYADSFFAIIYKS